VGLDSADQVQPLPSMTPAAPPPSARLRRAAAAEQEQLDRHRARLLQARAHLHAELERVERGLAEVDERRRLLERLAPAPSPTAPTATRVSDGRCERAANDPVVPAGRVGGGDPHELRGPAIRSEAVRLLLADPTSPEALHYRDWFGRLLDAGFTVAGKDPEAVFLTQLTRSPVLRKSTQAGVYELDRHAPQRLQHELDDLQTQLRALTAPTTGAADLAAVRARRTTLGKQISRAEKALEEALDLLGPPIDGGVVLRAAG
jgi:hypothetical protein